jgi:hypothetical protein
MVEGKSDEGIFDDFVNQKRRQWKGLRNYVDRRRGLWDWEYAINGFI